MCSQIYSGSEIGFSVAAMSGTLLPNNFNFCLLPLCIVELCTKIKFAQIVVRCNKLLVAPLSPLGLVTATMYCGRLGRLHARISERWAHLAFTAQRHRNESRERGMWQLNSALSLLPIKLDGSFLIKLSVNLLHWDSDYILVIPFNCLSLSFSLSH